MSNKTLTLVVLIIIVLFAGGVAYYKYQNSKQNSQPTNSTDNYTQTNSNPEETAGTNDKTMTKASPEVTATPAQDPSKVAGAETATAQCKRDFNQKTLDTAKVAIKNRQVEMDVKDFGKITVELYDQDAPKTVENFLRLTNSGYFDCLTFHRVARNFVIQGGDPEGNGTGGTSAFGKEFEDELNPNTASYKAGYVKGVLAMANSGPNTNGSQFFIMLGDVELPHNYTIFGKVIAGQDVVDKIGKVEITPVMGPEDGSPKQPVVMTSVKIIK